MELQISDSGEIPDPLGQRVQQLPPEQKASAETLADDWLHTGDAGCLEPDGQLVVLGRLSGGLHRQKNCI